MAVESLKGSIFALPEDLIATTLSLTTPKDVCRLAAVSSSFRSASEIDDVWDRFLPSDYSDIISQAVDSDGSFLTQFPSKKDLYLRLSDHPTLIDGGSKIFSLDKWSGKKCYMLAPRDLEIVWARRPSQWINLPEFNRFSEVAELLDICGFLISGTINLDMLSSGTNYAAYLVFTCKLKKTYGLVRPANASTRVYRFETGENIIYSDLEGSHQLVHLQTQQDHMFVEQSTNYAPTPRNRNDGWMEVELGEYFVERGLIGNLKVDVSDGNFGDRTSRGDLIIQGIEIRPKKSVNN